jgi:hypothetical protein
VNSLLRVNLVRGNRPNPIGASGAKDCPPIALEFAWREAESIEFGLPIWMQILPLLVDWSDWNPGAILWLNFSGTELATGSNLTSSTWAIAWAAESRKAPSHFWSRVASCGC